ncbi:MAG TPA: hypothetical protein PLF13_12365 [candidate division Zixibacteria bacterium]|nr:hypothetical protein [candidate division Zixibacteria bacterium]
MKERVDLHLHTIFSDGLSTPEELLELVRGCRLRAFSVTDHDSVDGYRAVLALMTENDPELVPGLELSCSSEGRDLHMLAYYFDSDSSMLAESLAKFQEKRNLRGGLMVKRLNELGVEINMDDVIARAGGAAIGRPHVAQALLDRGAIGSFEEAFRKYIGNDGPAYFPKENISPADAINIIHEAGGLAVIAHPVVSGLGFEFDDLIEAGLDGIEAFHPDHKQHEVDRLKQVASAKGLLITGGSDFHGRSGRCGLVGSEPVGIEYFERLKKAATQKRSNS